MSAALAVGELLPLVRFDPLQVQYVAVAAVGSARTAGVRAGVPDTRSEWTAIEAVPSKRRWRTVAGLPAARCLWIFWTAVRWWSMTFEGPTRGRRLGSWRRLRAFWSLLSCVASRRACRAVFRSARAVRSRFVKHSAETNSAAMVVVCGEFARVPASNVIPVELTNLVVKPENWARLTIVLFWWPIRRQRPLLRHIL